MTRNIIQCEGSISSNCIDLFTIREFDQKCTAAVPPIQIQIQLLHHPAGTSINFALFEEIRKF